MSLAVVKNVLLGKMTHLKKMTRGHSANRIKINAYIIQVVLNVKWVQFELLTTSGTQTSACAVLLLLIDSSSAHKLHYSNINIYISQKNVS